MHNLPYTGEVQRLGIHQASADALTLSAVEQVIQWCGYRRTTSCPARALIIVRVPGAGGSAVGNAKDISIRILEPGDSHASCYMNVSFPTHPRQVIVLKADPLAL